MPLHQESICTLRPRLLSGEISPADILRDLASAIEAREPALGAYLHIDLEKALADAATLSKSDIEKPLGGIPIALKDNINTLGHPCSCGSKILHGHYTAPYDATVSSRLRAAGAILFGRTNLDEFAMGSSTENSALQVTRNPWDQSRVPGGSSGGSAVVVAADTAIAALGSDTGGSIRQPAGFCGVVGLKPTYGRVSRFGLVAFASSLDQIGPITKCVDDAAHILEVISGHDSHDSTSSSHDVPAFAPGMVDSLAGLRIGLPKEYLSSGLDSCVREKVLAAADTMAKLGAELVEVSLPHTEYGVAAYYILAPAEASSNLARFDAVRYGKRAEKPSDILDLYTRSREEGFGQEVKRRILLGTFVLSSGFYDAYYLTAQRVRAKVREDFSKAFTRCDLLLGPTAPTPAFPIGWHRADPVAHYMADVFTIPANLAGLPALSVPCGFAHDNGSNLPVGLQLIGRPWDEATLLKVGKAYENATSWHTHRPY